MRFRPFLPLAFLAAAAMPVQAMMTVPAPDSPRGAPHWPTGSSGARPAYPGGYGTQGALFFIHPRPGNQGSGNWGGAGWGEGAPWGAFVPDDAPGDGNAGADGFGGEGLPPRPPSFAGNVPEPGTWMMLIAGFALIGLSLRRKKPEEYGPEEQGPERA